MNLAIQFISLSCLMIFSVALNLSEIPESFRDKFSEPAICKNPLAEKYVQKTRTKVIQRVISEKVKSGTTSCGIFGTGVCSLYTLQYKNVPEYSIETYDELEKPPCPGKLACPSGKMMTGGLCVSLADLQNPDIVQFLKELKKKN